MDLNKISAALALNKINHVITEWEIIITAGSGELVLWHGGNLDSEQDYLKQKGGRWESGPGLYLTTHYETARKYSKGSRKLYKVTVRKGTNITEVKLSLDSVKSFVQEFVIKAKRKEVLARIESRTKEGKIDADTFLNIMINEDAIKNTDTGSLRKFLVDSGIDYAVQDNAFGWHERMVVLFNMKNIASKTVVKPTDKIDVYDLPTEWS